MTSAEAGDGRRRGGEAGGGVVVEGRWGGWAVKRDARCHNVLTSAP